MSDPFPDPGPWDTPPSSHADPDPHEAGPADPPWNPPPPGTPTDHRHVPRVVVIAVVAGVVLLSVGVIAAAGVLPSDGRPDNHGGSLTVAKPSTTSTRSTPTDAASASQTAAAAATGAGGRYHAVAKPCDVTVWDPLENLLGPVVTGDARQHSTAAGPATTMSCSVRLGGIGQRGVATLQATVVNDSSAIGIYNGIRHAIQSDTQTSGLPNLGQEAYSYVDPVTGPHVTTYDGNLHLTVSWADLGVPPTVSITDIITGLAGVCSKTMANLKS
jgi:hypothetical protein